jgi:two-component system cell cycle response regulator CtrA
VPDFELPDMEGYEVVRRMRASRKDTPVLILSGNTKPQARVQAIVLRSKGFSQPNLRLGRVQLTLDSREVLAGGNPVHLTGKEYAILPRRPS